MRPALDEQSVIAGERPDHVVPVGEKEVLEYEHAVRLCQLCRGLQGLVEVYVPRAVLGIVHYLFEERRHQVEVLPDLREVLEYLEHVEIVLCAMQPYPGEPVKTRGRVFVVRLVHMPEEYDIERFSGHIPLNFSKMIVDNMNKVILN